MSDPIVSVRFTKSMPGLSLIFAIAPPETDPPALSWPRSESGELLLQSLSISRFGPAYGRLREKLRAARIEAGLTQGQVGRLVGKPQSFISKIEVGERGVDFMEIQVLARIYGKPLSYFEDKAEAQ